jgi:hypothetical protein
VRRDEPIADLITQAARRKAERYVRERLRILAGHDEVGVGEVVATLRPRGRDEDHLPDSRGDRGTLRAL